MQYVAWRAGFSASGIFLNDEFPKNMFLKVSRIYFSTLRDNNEEDDPLNLDKDSYHCFSSTIGRMDSVSSHSDTLRALSMI
jgi:hypothetical protein